MLPSAASNRPYNIRLCFDGEPRAVPLSVPTQFISGQFLIPTHLDGSHCPGFELKYCSLSELFDPFDTRFEFHRSAANQNGPALDE